MEIIKELFKDGADVNFKPDCYNAGTLLSCFIKLNSPKETILQLIDCGADVNLCDEDGTFPLMEAIKNRTHYDVIEKILEAGADVNKQESTSGLTPLLCVSCFSEKENRMLCNKICCNRKTVISLLNKGAIVNATDLNGNTFLHHAYNNKVCPDLINLLFSHGLNLEAKNSRGMTPLMVAVSCNNMKFFKLLLSLGANPNCCDHDFNTPLHKCIKEIFANLLVYHGADIDTAVKYNRRSLSSLISDESFHLGMIAIIKYSIIAKNKNIIESIVTADQNSWVQLYLEKCYTEISKMKETYIIDGFSYYDFCVLKISKNNKLINIPGTEYEQIFNTIKSFKNFYEFIKIRVEDHRIEKGKSDLVKKVSKISLQPINCNGNYSELNYDCLEEICHHLNYRQVYNLFLASVI